MSKVKHTILVIHGMQIVNSVEIEDLKFPIPAMVLFIVEKLTSVQYELA